MSAELPQDGRVSLASETTSYLEGILELLDFPSDAGWCFRLEYAGP
jgi:hypothetical protein